MKTVATPFCQPLLMGLGVPGSGCWNAPRSRSWKFAAEAQERLTERTKAMKMARKGETRLSSHIVPNGGDKKEAFIHRKQELLIPCSHYSLKNNAKIFIFFSLHS